MAPLDSPVELVPEAVIGGSLDGVDIVVVGDDVGLGVAVNIAEGDGEEEGFAGAQMGLVSSFVMLTYCEVTNCDSEPSRWLTVNPK